MRDKTEASKGLSLLEMRKKKRGAGARDLERACEEQRLKKHLIQKPSLQYMDPRKHDGSFWPEPTMHTATMT